MIIRGATKGFGIPFGSSKASEEDVKGITQNPTFSIGHSKPRQVSSHIYLYIFYFRPN
jgi:hypothetical protein